MSSNLDVGPFNNNIAVFQDQQSSGVAGTSPTGTIADQPLNTEIIGKAWASLSANQITLDPGEYNINVIDRIILSSSSIIMYPSITDAANNILDSQTGWGTSHTAAPAELDWTATISISVSTAIKYRTYKAAGTGTQTRPSRSQGTEHYQKLSIQKIG